MVEKEKQLLVLVDGSERSLLTIHYLTQVGAYRRMSVTLLHVFGDIPDSFWDLEKEPSSIKYVAEMRSWRRQQEKNLADYMDKCRKILIECGFPERNVTTKIHPLSNGVSGDIIAEAQKGYHAVVLRRRGVTLIGDLVMGSVAVKLLEKLSSVPIIIAGHDPVNQRVLIALDGSPGSARAVEFVGSVVADDPVEIELMHVIRKQDWLKEEISALEELEKEVQSTVPSLFNSAIDRLKACGVPSHNISTKLVTGVYSRAGAIVEEARQGQFGTIVVGRRGLSKIQEFYMGRVGQKVIQTAKKHTIWVVS